MDRPAPVDYQPALGLWSHGWRLAVMLAISALVWLGTGVEEQAKVSELWVAGDALVALGCYVLVFYRRRWPVTVAVVTGLASCVSGLSCGPASLAAVSVATHRVIRELAVVALVNFAAGIVYPALVRGEAHLFDVGSTAVVCGAMLAWGMYVGSRRELIWTLRHRAERAEAEQALRVAQARDHERHAIAREMHDVLAHRISQISMHAGALGFREDLSAEEMRASASVIRERAHEALTDLRAVLGVLRESGSPSSLRPQPTYADLADLIAETTASGTKVDYHDEVRGGPPPDAVGRTAYRIVQEGLTNARKHAPGARVEVRVGGAPGEGLAVELRNPLGLGPAQAPGAGLGLIGLAERAELSGGRLDHEVTAGTFVLRAWIPWSE
ncbi:sensor histidine kinase [Nocardioides cheoyonin]|uniref:sensor histidine kinase n=1 Tax=Nocardioides cheoyonin TaxID=3156615 RepID=UPI0032B620D6